MGCCQNRDVSYTQEPFTYHQGKTKSTPQETPKHTTLIKLEGGDSQTRKERSSSTYNSTAQAILYKKKQDWVSLKLMLDNDSLVKNSPLTHQWAAKPTSAKALALSFLAAGALKFAENIAPLIKELVPVLIEFLKTGVADLEDHSMLLLINTIDHISEEVKQDLADNGIFECLIPIINSKHVEKHNAAQLLCSKLCKDSKPRSNLFSNYKNKISGDVGNT